ncbi:hypothetical protein Aab01nite_72640 [Paractinoplanes abujensis]|uniref:Putative dinucleotide-binding enzyme n=1 Tax=Paractinoplanes abujensis TaxID=882441 RepID=A0A7W7G3S7_9ACTN|nr:dinucleotide-binding protein [Actinoplanes abujensis]MBB4694944.1 putative dinucleotide-binding enzyme [Actinoplanes abujensis]GID23674.1 hypothetical protein Aab01nite_72640 [Actinoplanes abujensis]
MNITVIGRGTLGGGLAGRWESSGHHVTRLGRGGGDVGASEVVLLAVPGDVVEAALASVVGLEGRTVLDATNLYGGAKPPAGFASNAEFVKSVTGGPTAKAFNANFASLFDRVIDARAWPSNLWSGDDETQDVVEQLSHEAGYEAVRLGQLTAASTQEGLAGVLFGIARSGLGEFVYRMAPPEKL